MYGNTPAGANPSQPDLTADERRALRNDLSSVAARTRDLLPDEFVVGAEITAGAQGPRATVAVQPPLGAVVSADYAPDQDASVRIEEDERTDIAHGLAASAALQVKQAFPDDDPPAAQ